MGWIVKIVVLCFVVGFVITIFDIEPRAILTNTWETLRDVAELAGSALGWALPYVLTGAVVVVPVAVVAGVLRWTRSRTRP